MKNLLLIGTVALLISSNVAKAEDWQPSCNSKYSNPSPNTYIFKVKKGEVGGCKSDKIKQQYMSTGWDWSERSEVLSDRTKKAHKNKTKEKFGKYEWSATIDIDRKCKPAERNTLFQVHAGGYLVSPPSWIGLNRYNKFRTNESFGGTNVYVPNEPFKLTAKINATKKEVKVDYFINDKFLVSTHSYAPGNGYKKMFFKFGIYRVNANCDITQTYNNVQLKRVK
jgi:hypothetical protein